MYLKRMEMQGFKSFADKTVLEFDKGITAIVGPNGSGKSNISDAVKWVLGEQSPKTLRGGKMEDVIFAGTQNRKPVGMAEVSMIMDNEDHVLNIDYLEVRITRRLYRSGESEYLINGAPARLKDIVMLFADTGIGRDGYSIIGQGRIDEILNHRSEERRGIFEDASGIMKYRMRKLESERKLAATEQNLLRINDIVHELETQLKPLEKQSETARRYLALKYELRDIEVGVLVAGITEAEKKLAETESQLAIINNDIEEKRAALTAIHNENSEATEQSRLLSEELAKLRNDIFEHEKTAERLKNMIALNEEKAVAANNNKLRLEAEQKAQAEKTGLYNKDIERLSGEKAQFEAEISDITVKGAAQADILIEYDKRLAEATAEAERIQGDIIQKKLEIGERGNALTALDEQVSFMTTRKQELDEELLILDRTDKDDIGELQAMEKQYEAENDAAVEAKQTYKNNAERLVVLRRNIDGHTKQISDASGRGQSIEAGLKLLREMEAGFEGYARSVKEVLQMCRRNAEFGDGIYGALAQLITVPREYETAVETALGQSYQNIITASERETKAAIEFLKHHRYGRATFMPITAVSGRVLDENTRRRLNNIQGFMGMAGENIQCDDKFRGIVDSLLGRVAVFNTLDSALAAAKEHKYSFVCVTIDGDILRTSGAITGGAREREKQTSGALSRTREIPQLEQELATIKATLSKLQQELDMMKDEADRLDKTQEQQFELVRESEAKASRLSSLCATLQERSRGRRTRREKLVEELKAQITFVVESSGKRENIESSIAELEGELSQLEESARMSDEQCEHIRSEREDVSRVLFELKMREQDVANKQRVAENEIERLMAEIASESERNAYYEMQISDQLEMVQQLAKDNETLEATISDVLDKANECRVQAVNIEQQKEETDDSLGGMLARITEINDTVSLLNEDIGRLEIRRVRMDNVVNSNKNRLWEEYELTPTSAAEVAKGVVIDDYDEASKRISKLKASIKELGPVNVNAVEEYEATLQRYDFMATQSRDMNESRLKLQKVVDELTEVMRERFLTQFEIIRKNFSDVFSELFGGGKADIVLADGEDVLECGIEINVQPPGKKLQNMMLLSGGERALTAIALLFGILRMRPSPFCLLDEIEAALDDANVYRLSDYLTAVASETQFIMVTHRKGTMEYAESLYGVTMEEKGVSKVVSLKMN